MHFLQQRTDLFSGRQSDAESRGAARRNTLFQRFLIRTAPLLCRKKTREKGIACANRIENFSLRRSNKNLLSSLRNQQRAFAAQADDDVFHPTPLQLPRGARRRGTGSPRLCAPVFQLFEGWFGAPPPERAGAGQKFGRCENRFSR